MPAPTFPRTSRACFAAARSKANRCTNRGFAGLRVALEGLSAWNDHGDIHVERAIAYAGKIHRRPRTIWSAEADNQRRMEKAKPLLEQLVKDEGLKAHSASWPSTEGYKNLLLYVDADHHFVINAVVRVPGRTGSVHDHADAWVLYGVLDGSESLERYERVDDGSRPGYAEVRLASVTTGTQGKVDLVAPGAIHA